MADYKKVIQILADTNSAASSMNAFFKDIGKQSTSVLDKFKSLINSSANETKEYFKPLLETIDKINKLTASKTLAENFGDIDKVKDFSDQLKNALDTLRSFGPEGEQLVAMLEGQSDAKMAFASLSPDIKKLEDAKAILSTMRLDPDILSSANVALDQQIEKTNQLKDAKDKLNALELAGLKNTKEYKALLNDIKKAEGKTFKSDVNKALSNLNPFSKERMDKFKENGKYNTVAGAALGKLTTNFYKMIANAIKSIGKLFVDTFKNSFKELANMATMDAGSTLLSNTAARQQQLTFGLTGAQNYAMTNAMKILNMSGIDDLMWANAEQKEEYNRLTSILEAQYSKLESTGIFKTVQEFQVDMALMKMQFQNTIYEFIAAHKPALEKLLNVALSFIEHVLEFLGWIADGLAGWFGTSYSSSDQLAAASTTQTNTNYDNSRQINVKVDYTNNEGGKGSEGYVSQSVINQLIAALNG